MESKNTHNSNQQMIDYSINAAQGLLKVFKGFYPIAAVVDNNGHIQPYLKFDHKKFPDVFDLEAQYHKLLGGKLANNKIKSYCIVYDVLASRTKKSEKTDAIAIRIINKDKIQPEVLYFAYKLGKFMQFEITDFWKGSVK